MNQPRHRFSCNRFQFFATGFALLFLSAAAAVVSAQVASPSVERKPNFIVINVDDMPSEQRRYLKYTANFFEKAGIVFRNAFVTTPICCPSRATLFTGVYAHNHGIQRNGDTGTGNGGAKAFTEKGLDQSTIAVWLKDAGYRTGLFGTYLSGYEEIAPYIPPGWDDWNAFAPAGYFGYSLIENGEKVDYGNDENDYSTDVLRDKALAFLRSTAQPFFLYFTPLAPHEMAVPAPRHEGMFSDVDGFPRKPNFCEEDVSDKPQWIQKKQCNDYLVQGFDEEYVNQLQALQAVDEAIKAFVNQLKSDGRLADTVIIFSSDNGFSFGAHRWFFKGCAYNECIRVPMAVAYPRLIKTPRFDDHLVSHVDITATIADLAGAVPQTPVNGKSLAPLFSSADVSFREAVLAEWWGDDGDCHFPKVCGSPTFQLVISEDGYKYVELVTEERELYNLRRDPYELENIAYQPLSTPVLEKMKALLERMRNE